MARINKDPLVSLIVATINKGGSLDEFILSLEKVGILENFRYEVILINNIFSRSALKEVEEKWGSYGIRFLHEPRKGKPIALNTGIRQAKGKYLAFTDDDVMIFDPNWLEKMIKEFENNPKLGYLSGNVVALENQVYAQRVWEENGGLGKGGSKIIWNKSFFNQKKFKLSPWLFHRICAGANSMISKKVMDKIGPFNILLGEGGVIGHGYTLEIGYRIAIACYDMMYNPEIKIYHRHPKLKKDLYKKMVNYGKGDTAYPLSIFLDFRDYRYLWWAFLGHPIHTLKKFLLRLAGRYNLPYVYILGSFVGSVLGAIQFLIYYLKIGKSEQVRYLNSYYNEK